MKILHVVPSYYPAVRYGGPIVSVHELCKSTVSLGHDVTVFTTNIDGENTSNVPLEKIVELDGVKIRYFAVPNLFRRWYWSPRMYKFLKKEINEFDFIHLHSIFLWPTSAAARVAREVNKPWCVSPRGALNRDMIERKSKLIKKIALKMYELKTLAGSSFLHATSLMEMEDIKSLGYKFPNIVVVPNGISIPILDKIRSMKNPYIIALGRISWKKGLDRLIVAMKFMPGYDLLIIGNDDEGLKPKLEKIASSNNLISRINFMGPIFGEKKNEFLKNAEILVLPSHNENFGNVVLESLACKRPVAVSRHVGLAPDIEKVNAGIIISDNPREMGQEIAKILSDKKKLTQMGENGYKWLKSDYGWDQVAAKMVSQYSYHLDKINSSNNPHIL
jgi:glycosyltransferase involved in cell wall biosynthesis